MWLASWLYAQTSPQVSWLQSGAFSALIGGVVAVAVAIYKDRQRNKVEEKRLSIDVFEAHKRFYDDALKMQADRTIEINRQLAVEQDRSKGLQAALTSMRSKWDGQNDEVAACKARVELLERLLRERDER